MKKSEQSAQIKLAKLHQDYQKSKEQMQALGHVLPGSLQKRSYSCGNPNCRCMAKGMLHGPYYQWTRKVAGKTVNINLDKDTAQLVTKWIANNRSFRQLYTKLQKISLEVLRTTSHLEKL